MGRTTDSESVNVGSNPALAAKSITYSYWVSSTKYTVTVLVIDDKVVWSPPLTKKFVGQPIQNLLNWFGKQKGFTYEITKVPFEFRP